jgi:hypothetical protein
VPPDPATVCTPVIAALYTTLLPALVTTDVAAKLTVEVPVVNAQRKLAFVAVFVPVCVIPEDAPVTVSPSVPVVVAAATFVAGEVIVLPPATVTVAVGTPENITFLAADESAVLEEKVRVTVAAPVPNAKLCDVVVIDDADAVIRLVPVRPPTIETPYPGEVRVDEISVRPVADAAPA